MINRVILCVFGLLLATCTTAPEFERDNKNDEGSESFIPDLPTSSEVTIAFEDDRELLFTFPRQEFQDGVVISKSYYGDGNFQVMDTLFSDTTYTDRSKQFIHGTTYSFNFFREVNQGDFVFNDAPFIAEVQVQPISSMIVSYGGRYNDPEVQLLAVHIYFNQNYKISSRIFDGVSIEINENTDGKDNWVEIRDLAADEVLEGENDLNYQVNLFDLELRLTQYMFDTTGTKVTISQLQRQRFINLIDDLRYSIKDEMNGTLTWKNPIGSTTEGYILSGFINDTIYTNGRNRHEISLTAPQTYPARFTLTPFIGANVGNTITSYDYYPNIHPPEFINLQSTDETTLELGWRDNSDDTYGYFLESKLSSETEFLLIDSLDKTTKSYTITNLNSAESYDFRVRTYTSNPSPVITTQYLPSLTITGQTELDEVGVGVKYSRNKKYRGKIVLSSPPQLHIENLETGTEYYHTLPEYDYSRKPRFNDFAISESTNSLAYLSDNHAVDVAGERVTILDFINDEIIESTSIAYGSYEIQVLENDSLFAYTREGHDKHGTTIINPFDASINSFIQLEYSFANDRQLSTAEFSNTILTCSESNGLQKLNLTDGSFTSIHTAPCFKISYRQDEQTINVNTTSGVKVFDFQSGTELASYNQLESDVYYAFYFKKYNALLYRGPLFNYHLKKDGTISDFLVPSLSENRRGSIMYITSNSDDSYQMITYDADFTVKFKDAWAITNTED